MKKAIIVFAVLLLVASCAKKEDVQPTEHAITVFQIPYDEIKRLPVGRRIEFPIGNIQRWSATRLEAGYLFVMTASGWSDAGITSTFILVEDF